MNREIDKKEEKLKGNFNKPSILYANKSYLLSSISDSTSTTYNLYHLPTGEIQQQKLVNIYKQLSTIIYSNLDNCFILNNNSKNLEMIQFNTKTKNVDKKTENEFSTNSNSVWQAKSVLNNSYVLLNTNQTYQLVKFSFN